MIIRADQKTIARFHSALRDLAKISGADFEAVMKNEVGAILNRMVKTTPKSTQAKVRSDAFKRRGGQYRIDYAGNNPAPATQRRSENNGVLFYDFTYRHPNWLWAQLQKRRADSLARAMEKIGLTAKMWWLIGQKLGIPVAAPPKVIRARTRKNGEGDRWVTAQASGQGKTYRIYFANELTKQNAALGIGAKFRQAVNARANFFRQAVKLEAKGVIRRALDRYPGLARVS